MTNCSPQKGCSITFRCIDAVRLVHEPGEPGGKLVNKHGARCELEFWVFKISEKHARVGMDLHGGIKLV